MPEHIIVPERIILMRHGETGGSPYEDLRLAPKGMQQVINVVDQWMAAGLQINFIRHSPKLRTMETALIAAKKTGVELTKVAASTDIVGPRPRLTDALRGLDGTVLLVTHGPEIFGLLSVLTDRQENDIVKCGQAFVIERNGNEWESEDRLPDHKLKQVFSPKVI